MALSPCSLNPSSSSSCRYASSHSLYFLLLRPQTHFLVTSRAPKFRISCSQRVVQVDSEQRKKKRKPRPSFFQQIQEKWSARIGSEREKFPWQEESSQLEQGDEEEEEETETETEAETETGTEIDGKESVSDSVSFGTKNGVVSAPWAHGTKPIKPFEPQVVSEPETLENGDNGDFHDIAKPRNGFQREFDAESGEVSEEEREVSNEVNGFSLDESSDYETSDLPWKKEVNDINKASNRLQRDFVAESDEVSEEEIEVSNDSDYESSDLLRKEEGVKKRSNTAIAETTLPEHELKRLRNVSLRMLERTKVGARGITQALVDSIHEKWKLDEVVKLKFEEPHSLNMKRTHQILESKTGGLVIWRSGSSVVLYRGITYNLPCVQSYTKQNETDSAKLRASEDGKSDIMHDKQVKGSVRTIESSTPTSVRKVKDPSVGETMHLNDLNQLLDELGPRFTDWLGREPLPVDADLLPSVVSDYRTPFRILPYGVKPSVRNKEMTKLRQTARMIPPHFALGRNRELQGLAKAMVKLWEKSAIAKIAIKRGVQNTCNERMAEELKRLTGGTLLSRNKDFIVFYRGNDFLPPAVVESLEKRKKLRDLKQDEEEKVRQMAPAFIQSKSQACIDQLVAGTLAETMAATARWGNQPSTADVEKMVKDSTLARHAAIIRHLEKKLALAKGNLTKAEKAIVKLQQDLDPSDLPNDLETITDEERFLFCKIGLSMEPFLLLGRRGLYSGTIENMHLHWKFRELVKVIVKGKSFEHVKQIAISLEAESGGILVSIDKTSKGYAILVYRGKNYQSPVKIRPQNLLTRRQALARSIELQRREALRHHIIDLQERIGLLKSELEESRNGKMADNEGAPHLTTEDSLSDDEATEDDSEDEYLEIYDSGDEGKENEELKQVQ